MKRPKYGNRKVKVGDLTFDSQREAGRWQTLQWLVKSGDISDLQRQVAFRMIVNGLRITTYRADFTYTDNATGELVVEDAKGMPDRRWPMVKKLMKACHGIDIREV